ncbi:hypothetical protein V8C86DRAFT_3112649, partial [Haematococcus lacustris]
MSPEQVAAHVKAHIEDLDTWVPHITRESLAESRVEDKVAKLQRKEDKQAAAVAFFGIASPSLATAHPSPVAAAATPSPSAGAATSTSVCKRSLGSITISLASAEARRPPREAGVAQGTAVDGGAFKELEERWQASAQQVTAQRAAEEREQQGRDAEELLPEEVQGSQAPRWRDTSARAPPRPSPEQRAAERAERQLEAQQGPRRTGRQPATLQVPPDGTVDELAAATRPGQSCLQVWKELMDPTLRREHAIVAWRVLHGSLMVGALWGHILKGAAAPGSSACRLCQPGQLETLTHAFLTCPAVAPVWEWVLDVYGHLTGTRPPSGDALLLLSGRPTRSEAPPFQPPDSLLWLRLRVAYLGTVWRLRSSGAATALQPQMVAQRVAEEVVLTLSSAVKRDWHRVGRDIRVGLCGAVPSTWFRGTDPELGADQFDRLWPEPSGGWFAKEGAEERALERKVVVEVVEVEVVEVEKVVVVVVVEVEKVVVVVVVVEVEVEKVSRSVQGVPSLHAATNGNTRWMSGRERALVLGLMAGGHSHLFRAWPAPGRPQPPPPRPGQRLQAQQQQQGAQQQQIRVQQQQGSHPQHHLPPPPSAPALTPSLCPILLTLSPAAVRQLLLVAAAAHTAPAAPWLLSRVKDAEKRSLISAAAAAMAGAVGADTQLEAARLAVLQPPLAAPQPKVLERHGDRRVDDYYWLRDDKREDQQVLQHLEKENAYTRAVMADTEGLQ